MSQQKYWYAFGKLMTINELSDFYGIPKRVIKAELRKGKDMEKIVESPDSGYLQAFNGIKAEYARLCSQGIDTIYIGTDPNAKSNGESCYLLCQKIIAQANRICRKGINCGISCGG